jgi:small-conductance mechanosensitive channel
MSFFQTVLEPFLNLLNIKLFELGVSTITVGSILFFFISVIFVIFLSERVRHILSNKILKRYKVEIGLSQAIGGIVKYSILVIGFTVVVHSVGIDMSALGFIAGALTVGIGFGLQNITNNFVSGIIILFERPIKIGDRIEVGEIKGRVVDISARATTVTTNDNISVIIPNSEFISSKVINWSHSDLKTRFNFKVGVSYKEDPQKIKEILLGVAKENIGILAQPAPDVLLLDFGDSSIDFTLRVWTTLYVHNPLALKSQLFYEIHKRFKEENVEIPFPQRDLHIKTGFEKIT